MAYQHPFGRNKNGYVIEDPDNTPENKQYYESAKLKRGDDLIFRLQHTINVKPGKTLTIGTIPIFRLQKSEIEKNGEYIELEDTKGLTMNMFFNWNRKIDDYKSFSLTGGFPIVDRDYRPDGLTRTFTFTVSYLIKLNYPKKQPKAIEGLFTPIEQQ